MTGDVPEGLGTVVRYERRGDHVAVVTLDRPAARNAINGAIASAIDHCVKTSEADPDIRAVVLASSHPTVFCAGADLAEIAAGNAARLATPDGGFGGFTHAARTKPWIAAVGGAAFAGGCELALACDMIVAGVGARFGLPEVKRGLFAAAGGPYRLIRALPRAIAIELVTTGDPLDAERAFALGLVNRLVAPEAVLDAAMALAEAIVANAPMSVAESLRAARDGVDLDEPAYWRLSKEIETRVFASEDAAEGPRAFLEKRPPRWIGR